MKTIHICTMLLLFVCFGQAQTTPESFLARLPSPPGNACATGENSGKSEFIEKVSQLDAELDEEISKRQTNVEQKFEANEDKMMQNAMARTGVSPQLMQQMMAIEKASKGATGEQKKALDAKKRALAGQMMQQSTNISMGEIENMKKMSKEGKTAWAEAYATEKKAEVMADPKAYQDKNAALMKDYKLIEKQRLLADSLGAQVIKFKKRAEELDTDKEAINIQTKIAQLESELNDLYKQETVKDSEVRGKINAIRILEINYCNLQSPKYLAIVAAYKNFVASSLKDYARLEKLTYQVTAKQTGVDIKQEPGAMGLGQIRSYLSMLSGVYKYNNIRPEAVYGGAE